MLCAYPLCRQQASWMPVIKIPTVRSIGVIKPTLNVPLIQNEAQMRKWGLIPRIVIHQYESQLKEYSDADNIVSPTEKPTILMGKLICQFHKDGYNLMDWISPRAWGHLREAARAKGFDLPDGVMITVVFRPPGWTPKSEYLEVVR